MSADQYTPEGRFVGAMLDLMTPLESRRWADIEACGLTGLSLLVEIIGALGPLPVRSEIRVRSTGLGVDSGWGDPRFIGWLDITYWAPDAYNPREVREQKFRMTIPGNMGLEEEASPLQWARWLMWALAYLAVHEVAEFFVVGGERLFDPHAKGAVPVLEVPPMPLAMRV
jgi:hypothetical protein